MTEVITVEAVSDKFKNKYNSGSVLANGKWMQVSSKLNLDDFQKDSQVTVETKTNDKGYTSIVKLIRDGDLLEPSQPVERTPKAVESAIIRTATDVLNRKSEVKTYEENKSRRILVQGIVQAALQCPSLAGVPYTNTDELVANAKNVALQMIDFVDEQSK